MSATLSNECNKLHWDLLEVGLGHTYMNPTPLIAIGLNPTPLIAMGLQQGKMAYTKKEGGRKSLGWGWWSQTRPPLSLWIKTQLFGKEGRRGGEKQSGLFQCKLRWESSRNKTRGENGGGDFFCTHTPPKKNSALGACNAIIQCHPVQCSPV